MATKEEIRGGIDASICMHCEEDVDKRVCAKAICAYASDLRNTILKRQHSQGVVIKVDRELPHEDLPLLILANFIIYEPLI